MKKIISVIIVLFVVLVGVFLVAPFGVGFWLKRYDVKRMANITDINPNIHADILSYHRGWFSSDISTKVTVYVNKETDKPLNVSKNIQLTPVTVTLHTLLKHGPFLFDKHQEGSRLHLGWGLAHTRFVEPKMPIEIDSRIGMRKVVSLLSGKQAVFQLPKATAGFSGLKLVVSSDVNMDGATFNGVIKSLQLKKQSDSSNPQMLSLTVNDLTMQGKFKQHGRLALGDFFVASKRLTAVDQAQRLAVNQAKVHWNAKLNNQQLTMGLLSSIKSVNSNGLVTGPYHLNYQLSKVDLPKLQKLLNTLHVQSQQHVVSMPAVMSGLLDIAQKGVQLDIDGLGSLQNQEKVALKSVVKLAPTAHMNFGPFSLIANLTLEANITVPRRLLSGVLSDYFVRKNLVQPGKGISAQQMADQQIQTWEKQKRLSIDGPNLTSKISFGGGKLQVNGLPMQL